MGDPLTFHLQESLRSYSCYNIFAKLLVELTPRARSEHLRYKPQSFPLDQAVPGRQEACRYPPLHAAQTGRGDWRPHRQEADHHQHDLPLRIHPTLSGRGNSVLPLVSAK